MTRLTLAIFFCSLAFAIASSPFAKGQAVEKKEFYKVLRVIDGDTIDVKMSSGTKRIRIIGLNTPETKDPRKPVECFGKEASKKAKDLLQGKKILLISDPSQGDKDKFGRLLRYVVLEDGTNFSEAMIRDGFGHEYTYQIPHKLRDSLKVAQAEAEKNKRGLWADDACKKTGVQKESTSTGKYKCDCAKTCPNLTCDEAYFQLEKCGCHVRDRDGDGVPCEKQCKGQERS